MHEKRRFPRQPVELSLTVHTTDGQTIVGKGRDISLGGVFIEAAPTLAFATHVEVELTLPDLGLTRLPAIVRWNKVDGMGLQFGLLGARQTHAISNLVASTLGPPSGEG